jgi:DNA transposition AAA+ family ATPase
MPHVHSLKQVPVEMRDLPPAPRCSEPDAAVMRAADAMQKALELSNTEVAKRADIPLSTYSEAKRFTYSGNYGPIAAKLRRWITSEETRLETDAAGLPELGFVETSMARKMLTAMKFAQSRPAMVLCTLGAGLGKTMTLKHFEQTTPHALRVVIEPTEGRPAPAIRKIAAAYEVTGFHTTPLLAELKRRVSRDSGRQPVLLVDEAQNLSNEAVNQLRFLLDEAGCGIVLAGNEDLMARYSLAATREGYGQIHRRIFMRVHIKVAPIEDIDLILGRLRITDEAIIRLCRQIGTRVGGLGQVVETLEFASQLAFGHGRAIAAADVKAAWANRANEELR